MFTPLLCLSFFVLLTMKKFILFFIGIHTVAFAQEIDVQSYQLNITVSDTSNVIEVREDVHVLFTQNCEQFALDLVTQDNDGTGMLVTSVTESGMEVAFQQKDNQLLISTKRGSMSNIMMYTIHFSGIPKDGLVIGENKFGNRTFFGDNWPNRAHNWFACVDHPSDKASISYTVIAPKHFDCVANGKMVKVDQLNASQNKYTFRSDILLPTKVMVIGLADFESQSIENSSNVELKAWVYPEDASNGFYDMSVAKDPLAFYIESIGPYPFEKLDNVQSTTRFGGMENAGCIFYDEGAVTGSGKMENLIAHEIAHQWFGNSVTESDWPHLWLSEGFATYFTNLHLENKYGRVKMNEQLKKDRNRIVSFSKQAQLPVIDTISTDLMQLLNPNAYEKGSWFLHMLRIKVGEEAFWEGIQLYYQYYQFKNASSDDFQKVMSKVSEQDLAPFFDQWLRNSGHPQLKVTRGKKMRFTVEQVQEGIVYQFPLELKVNYSDGQSTVMHFDINSPEFTFKSNEKKTIQSIELDPNTNLLFEEVQ